LAEGSLREQSDLLLPKGPLPRVAASEAKPVLLLSG